MPYDSDIIERDAGIADRAADELQALLPKSRKGQYDRQGPKQVQYAIRWCRKIAERIRAQRPVSQDEGASVIASDPQAIALLRELRPLIEKARDSKWRTIMLSRVDAAIKAGAAGSGQ